MKRTLTFLVILITILCISNATWWFYVCSITNSFEAAKAAYHSIYPAFLIKGVRITLCMLLLSGFNIAVTMYYIDKRKQLVLYIPLLILNSIVFTWYLWTLM